MSKRLCKICGKETGKKPNSKYCENCSETLRKRGAYRYKITDGVYVWAKQLKRAVVNGRNVEPIIEDYEVCE